MRQRASRFWNIIPAFAVPVAVATFIRLEPAGINLANPDWTYTFQFARNHALDYTVLTLAVLILTYWFRENIQDAFALTGKAVTAALGLPPVSHGYDLALETSKMLFQKIKHDFNEKFRTEGRAEGMKDGIMLTLHLEHPDADKDEIQRLYQQVIANLDSKPRPGA